MTVEQISGTERLVYSKELKAGEGLVVFEELDPTALFMVRAPFSDLLHRLKFPESDRSILTARRKTIAIMKKSEV